MMYASLHVFDLKYLLTQQQFASLQLANLGKGAHSLTHTMPRNMPKAQEIYSVAESMYPFPVFAGWCGESAHAALVGVLPKQEELFRILDLFQRRGQSSSFPHTPDEVTKREVERFLDDAEGNAQKYPDMLALIFATLAMGLQLGQWDRDDGQWVEGAMAGTTRTADIYGEWNCQPHLTQASLTRAHSCG